MRTRVALVVACLSFAPRAHADDPSGGDGADSIVTLHRLHEQPDDEPLLHLDMTPLAAEAEGGIVDGRAAALDLGPRARLAAEGRWWQTGLAPSMFATDLREHGWRAAAELSYDLGPFRVGVNASLTRDGESTHRAVGLFAFRTFRLSRWMHAWIMLGVALEQWDVGDGAPRRQGVTAGLSIGTTFR